MIRCCFEHVQNKSNNLTVYFIPNPEGHRPKWKHKHINTWWLIHTKHKQGNKIVEEIYG